jgi:serine/threonine protein kinase
MVEHLMQEYNTSRIMSFCDHCFHIQAATRDDDKLTFRLFSEYAGDGDLDDMIKLYCTDEHSDKQIPEPFVWMIFHAVAESIYAMNTGRCGEKEDKDQEEPINETGMDPNAKEGKRNNKRKAELAWNKPIVHLDIKPPNVFLTFPQKPYQAYPNHLLADFDIAALIGTDTDNRPDRKGLGTSGYRAPEVQVEAMHQNSVTTKADIYSLGMVIWRMMHTTLGYEKSRDLQNENIDRSFQFPEGNTLASDDIPGYNAMYSRALHQLVNDCLQINPDRRPGYQQLRVKTKAGFLTSQKRLGNIQVNLDYGGEVSEHLRVLRKEGLAFSVGERFQGPARKKRKGNE